MRWNRYLAIGLTSLVLASAASGTVAQTPDEPPTPVEIRANAVEVRTTRFWYLRWQFSEFDETAFIRPVHIEASARVNVRLYVRPLVNVDGIRSYGIHRITLGDKSAWVDPQAGANLDLKFNTLNLPAGEFKSQLTIVHKDGKAVVPITLFVRDPIEPVLFVLILGLVISLGVTSYVLKKRDIDHLKVSSYRLEDRVRRNRTIHESFRSKIISELDRVQFTARQEDIEEATKIFNSVNGYWTKWHKHASGWMHYLAEADDLIQRAERIADGNPNVMSLLQALQSICINAVDMKSPDELDQKLDPIRQALSRADQVKTAINRMAHLVLRMREDIDANTRSAILADFDHYKDEFKKLDLEKPAQVDNLEQLVNSKVNEIRANADDLLLPEAVTPKGSLGRIVADVVSHWTSQRPDVHLTKAISQLSGITAELASGTFRVVGLIDWDRIATAVRWRTFRVVGYLVLMVLLAGAGLDQLYLNNYAFGAKIWSDYISLFAWGFGAEAARNSVARLASSWQLPGLQGAGQKSGSGR